MPQPWIKLHTGLVSNPKVMSLPADVFKVWILTLVETKRYNENGVVPPLPQLAFAMSFRSFRSALCACAREYETIAGMLLDRVLRHAMAFAPIGAMIHY